MAIKINVKNNNVEFALKKLKRKVKDSELFLDLREKSYYKKPSKKIREKKNLQALKYKWKNMKENDKYQ